MARPRKIENDDRYNEASLNLEQEARFEESDPEREDVVPELGEIELEDRLALLREADETFDDE